LSLGILQHNLEEKKNKELEQSKTVFFIFS